MTTTPQTRGWAGPDSAVCRAVERFSADCLRTYEVDVRRISEDANIEKIATEGGYARRQLYELIQNGADELIERRGRIEVVLTKDALYCANEGRPVSVQGVGAILGSHNSTKSGVEIGRFGLGFKSVLGVSRTPAVYSTSGSFGFDAERNLDAVRRIAPDATRAAVLRLAAPLDPVGAATDDPVLAALMRWADTIVVMPRDTGAVDWLNDAIREFPREFLLFSSHVEQLVLDDRTGDGFRRVIELEEGDNELWELHERGDEGGKTAWKLFTTTHSPSEAVKRDGGTMAERPIIPLHWAVPISRPVPGRLWAFFPTTVATTLSGVINAPWKLDESRTTLVPGEFNEELLRTIVELVVENLDAVNREGDPGYYLELLPGRGKELKGWADEVLSTAIYEAAAAAASLPDQRGVLQPPASLQLLPSTVSAESAEVWAAQPTRPVSWVHPSAIRNATRRSRAERLLESAQVQPSTEQEWLEALVAKKSAQGSIGALKVAGSVAYSEAEIGMRKARIVLTSDGKLTRPVRGAVYLPAAVDVDVDVPLVSTEVLEDADALQALRDLKIAEVSGVTVLEALVDRAVSGSEASRDWNWTQIWDLARRVSEADLAKVLLESHQLDAAEVFVQSMAGGMVRLSTVLLPGDLLSPQDFKASHRALLVDIEHHRRELGVLRRLGATDRPVRGGGSQDEPWLAEYRRMLIAQAIDEARTHGARVKPEHYDLLDGGPWGGPATPLDGLSDEAAARYARELLVVTENLDPWTLRRHKGRVIDIQVEHPILWRVRQLGVLETDMGLRPIDECITSHLRALSGLLPVADVPRSACRAFHLPDTVDELDAKRVSIALDSFGDLDREDAIGAAYSALLPVIAEPPAQMRAMVRREATWISPAEVCASHSVGDTKVLRGTGTPFVRFDTEEVAERFVAAWGLQRIADVVASKVMAIPDGDRELAADRYPLLRLILGRPVEKVEFLPCRELHREVYTEQGSISEPLEFELRDDVAYHRSDLSEVDLVRRLSERMGKPLGERDAHEVLENAQAAEVQALLKQVRAVGNDPQRLLLLVGAEALRSRIPDAVLDAVEETDGDLDGFQIAELALTVFGIETLKEYRDALVERGLSPPGKWAGLKPAVRFVTEELGFPRKYAGFADVRVEDTLEVAGPSPLPPLHPFQDLAAEAIRSLIRRQKHRRGLLSLPTGAGKTRVAVEALVSAMAAGEVASPVLWIAQTMELCEQAVRSWAEVWRAVGPDRSLKISRLWGSYSAEPREDDGDQVVVATIAKLTQIMGNDAYDWLSNTGCVVVDEAHTSIAPSYTQLLGWAGIDRASDHAPLIGLSATPFRGVSVEETDRLASRYGRHRLDDGIFGEEVSISLLQRERILARVDHHILDGSEQVPLTSAEREHIKTLRSLPPSVLAKIGRDLDRTNRLVESVMNLPDDWPVLMFAASLRHAETLAALIARRGRTAAAIFGETPAPVRRHLVDEFRAGRLQTLVNYGVLTQGFDAPSIRALYIARPTYSPNLYQQMIGRGLRGPKNNGKEVCLVVDVADNVVAYGLELAFRDFEYVWKS